MQLVSRITLTALALLLSISSLNARGDKVYNMLKGKLVIPQNGTLIQYNKLDQDTKFYAFYFSAHWCPPCRKFTPKLVKFYEKLKKDYDNFEIIFVSSDRSEEAMLEYMEWGNMHWPAVKFDLIFSSSEITKYAGPGIPCLVVVDAEGNVRADSYIGSTYIGPTKPMEAFGQLIKKSSR